MVRALHNVYGEHVLCGPLCLLHQHWLRHESTLLLFAHFLSWTLGLLIQHVRQRSGKRPTTQR